MSHQPSSGRGQESSPRTGLYGGVAALARSRRARRADRSVVRTPAVDEWVNEGGSVAPPGAEPQSSSHPLPGRRSKRSPGDTVAGCRERAAADLVQASTMNTHNARLRLERSAASWTARAEQIQQLDDSFDARRAEAMALWAVEEEHAAPEKRVDPDEARQVRP